MRAILRSFTMSAALLMCATAAGAQGAKPLTKCAPDAVVSGTVCMDTYEASVWRVPNPETVNKGLVKKIQQGKATVVDLAAGGATQLGAHFPLDDYLPCTRHGQNCADDIYAVSLPGVRPSSWLSWFQAQAACDNAGKRLPSNAEWQAAVMGSPDPGPDNGTTDCNSTFQPGQEPALTGSRSSCVSTRGAFDMVGNLYEWVADWVPRAPTCHMWNGSDDDQCLLGAETTGEPGALRRGGYWGSNTGCGPLAIVARNEPSVYDDGIGFRCAR